LGKQTHCQQRTFSPTIGNRIVRLFASAAYFIVFKRNFGFDYCFAKNYKKSTNSIIKCNEVKVYEAYVKANNKNIDNIISINDYIEFYIKYEKNTTNNIHITLHLKDEYGNKIFSTGSGAINQYSSILGICEDSVIFPANFFNWGKFSIDLYIIRNKKEAIFVENDFLSFVIVNDSVEFGAWMGKEPGPIHPNFEWKRIKLIE